MIKRNLLLERTDLEAYYKNIKEINFYKKINNRFQRRYKTLRFEDYYNFRYIHHPEFTITISNDIEPKKEFYNKNLKKFRSLIISPLTEDVNSWYDML